MQNRHKLILLITLILLSGFSLVSFLMYQVSKQSIHEAITVNELPLTTDSIYSEIQKDLIKSINISAMMATNTFLIDWLLQGEKDNQIVKKYLQEVKQNSHAFTSFFVSEATRNYYSASAETKKVQETVPADAWYFHARTISEPYELNVDEDARLGNQLTIFVNYRVLDSTKRYLGMIGVGINYDSARKLLENYEVRFKRKVYFVSDTGKIVLASDVERPLGSNVKDTLGIAQINFNARDQATHSYAYDLKDTHHLVNVRYIPELNWYLFVEKNETQATENITNSLYRNLLLCLAVTGLVVALTNVALKRYHLEVESAAAIDKLTSLPNRKAFDIGMSVILQESERNKTDVGIILLDLDHFKSINDQYGHIAGDHVLKNVATTLKSTVRAADFISRWGGEEFLIVVRDCGTGNLLSLAENIRSAIELKGDMHNKLSINVTASLGVALRSYGEELEHLIGRADKALYQAKGAGRNQVVLAS